MFHSVSLISKCKPSGVGIQSNQGKYMKNLEEYNNVRILFHYEIPGMNKRIRICPTKQATLSAGKLASTMNELLPPGPK